ncbi:hypothetical protein GE21DRAFT_1313656 [Neurospora crassa]|nr:hypothetical protein GE21DRAFT_1313656 [Neurospora crassa]
MMWTVFSYCSQRKDPIHGLPCTEFHVADVDGLPTRLWLQGRSSPRIAEVRASKYYQKELET